MVAAVLLVLKLFHARGLELKVVSRERGSVVLQRGETELSVLRDRGVLWLDMPDGDRYERALATWATVGHVRFVLDGFEPEIEEIVNKKGQVSPWVGDAIDELKTWRSVPGMLERLVGDYRPELVELGCDVPQMRSDVRVISGELKKAIERAVRIRRVAWTALKD